MKFKEFVNSSSIEEGWLSKMFGGAEEPSLVPKMLRHGDAKSPAKSYGGNYRSQAIAKKWQQIQASGDAARAKRAEKLGR